MYKNSKPLSSSESCEQATPLSVKNVCGVCGKEFSPEIKWKVFEGCGHLMCLPCIIRKVLHFTPFCHFCHHEGESSPLSHPTQKNTPENAVGNSSEEERRTDHTSEQNPQASASNTPQVIGPMLSAECSVNESAESQPSHTPVWLISNADAENYEVAVDGRFCRVSLERIDHLVSKNEGETLPVNKETRKEKRSKRLAGRMETSGRQLRSVTKKNNKSA